MSKYDIDSHYIKDYHIHIDIIPRCLYFKKPVKTSRGTYTHRKSWFLCASSRYNPMGIGECAPLPGLSCDDIPEYETVLSAICEKFNRTGIINLEELRPYPSILFGLETAFQHHFANSTTLWVTRFSRRIEGIPINGLVWMGSYEDMARQVEEKLEAGFRCIKLKIGAINFDDELALLKQIRARFSAQEIELRVDANGAFSPDEAMMKLNRLAELDIHSIEQPIRAGQWEEMARLTAISPIPIALDEELIGCNTPERKRELLSFIRPQYIILKPSLHGGLHGCDEWIEEARKLQIGWWATSALESNIGLNAIAQWCSTYDWSYENMLPQGLGTGEIFTNNCERLSIVRNGHLWIYPPDTDVRKSFASW